MPEHKTANREEWQAARDELAKLEAEAAERQREATEKRRELPWVPVEKEYVFETQDGKEDAGRAFPRPLAAARLQRHVRARSLDRGLPWVHEPGRRVLRRADPSQPARRHLRSASGARRSTGSTAYKVAMGRQFLYASNRRHRLSLGLRPGADRGAGAADPGGPGDAQRSAGVASVLGLAERVPTSNTGCARTRATSRSRRRNGTVDLHLHGPLAVFLSSSRSSASGSTARPKEQPDDPTTYRKDEYPD